jgi:phosphatidylethanolamine/phosphatidyl-N-methylethanolamine N-methyltransferase
MKWKSDDLNSGKESRLRFLVEFFKNPLRVGSISPSSEHLTKAMLKGIDFEKLKAIFEYGPGTGVFTKEILSQLGPDRTDLLTVVELEPEFSEVLRNRFSGLRVLTQKASEVSPASGAKVDAILSSLPFTFIPWEESEKTIHHVTQILESSGLFRTYLYVQSCFLPKNLRLLLLLRSKFKLMKVEIVFRNFPPAAVFTYTSPLPSIPIQIRSA